VPETFQIHATCVEISGAGILLLGPPGSGKSDLALRLIDGGARLVADDRTDLRRAEESLMASAPQTIAGRMEVRGLDIVTLPYVHEARIRLAVDLVAPDRIERLPESAKREFLGVAVALIRLAPFEASAAAKVRLAARSAAA
jgi:serine kinase of HPr protein (carbohydrate metabolism regulator)